MELREEHDSTCLPEVPEDEKPLPSVGPIRLGLPHLGLYGLSENWVLRECGDRHWNAIAVALDRPPERTFDRNGNRLYASICGLTIRGSIKEFREGDEVEITAESSTFLSAFRYYSSQTVRNRSGAGTVTIELLSVFVQRKRSDDNKSLAPSRPFESARARRNFQIAGASVPGRNFSLRTRQNEFEIDDCSSQPFKHVYSPSPATDFNAAGLFYFAEYPTLIDRVEWLINRNVSLLRSEILERRISYVGSPNLGDDLSIEFFPLESPRGELRHVVRVFEASSKRLLARVHTTKKLVAD
jgi:probable biosynthetic protein (TIGR04099 family)